MGLVDAIFGTGGATTADDETDESKYAILLSAGPDDPPVASNAFNYALELAEAGYEVQVFLDGQATKWPGAFADDPDLPFAHDWNRMRELGLLAGACGYCANAFDATAACEDSGIELLSDEMSHAPAVARLADDGYEMLTIG